MNLLDGRRLLVIMGRVPWPMDDGWKMRSGNILRGLAIQGAHLDLVAFGEADQGPGAGFENTLRTTRIVPRIQAYAPTTLFRGLVGSTPFSVLNYQGKVFESAVVELWRDRVYEGVLVEDVVMAQYVPPGANVPLFLDMHNVESHLMARYAREESRWIRKGYAALTARKLARYERDVSGRFNAIFVCSEVDRERLEGHGVETPVHVVPNGIDPLFFQHPPGRDPDGSLVFVGSMDYHANISGILHFARHILPRILARRPDVRIFVVGKNPPPEVQNLASENVVVTGTVPDVRPYLARAAVVVVPLLVGGGTRLKILEAMAMGRAVVSTRLGAEGIQAEEGRTIALADTPAEFSREVLGLLDDPSKARTMGDAAREFVFSAYNWKAITERIARLVRGEIASS